MANSETRVCQSCKNQFVIEPDDFTFYEKMKVPPPTWCPECRMIRRFSWRNEHQLFRRPDSRTGKAIFSGMSKEAPFVVYKHDFWWSDGWDPMDYGREYDFSRPFFEQLDELFHKTPWPSGSVLNLVNSDYCINVAGGKNSYLCFGGLDVENSAYVVGFNTVKEGFDLYQSRHAELCYDSYMVDESFRVFFSINCENCTDVWFSKNLMGCSNCFGCMNLRSKSYHLFNKKVSKDEYQNFMKEFSSGSHIAIEEMRKRVYDLWSKLPNKFTLSIQAVNSTGEHIEHVKNVKQGFFVHDAENLGYCQMVENNVTDSYDATASKEGSSEGYENVVASLGASRIKFSSHIYSGVNDIEYSVFCPGSNNLFACAGLKKKQYCIFNKQYSKDEYFVLRDKIIKHMNEMPYIDPQGRNYTYGEFFPAKFSPFAYNETIAQDFFPLTKAEAEAKGFLWREPEAREFQTTIDAADLPDDIKDAPDSIAKEVIKCSSCSKAYRIIPMEFEFYKRIALPLPRLCPDCRFKRRFIFVNPPKLWHGECQCAGVKDEKGIYANAGAHFHGSDHCPNEFETSYAPGRPEIVYCEKCYQQEAV